MARMTAEAAVAVTAEVLASSIALVGFGLDSVIEFFAAAVVVWQLRGEEEGQERETPVHPTGAPVQVYYPSRCTRPDLVLYLSTRRRARTPPRLRGLAPISQRLLAASST